MGGVRNDSGLAAAELALAVERAVLATGSVDTVGTAGKVVLHPGAINSIPSLAHLEIGTLQRSHLAAEGDDTPPPPSPTFNPPLGL